MEPHTSRKPRSGHIGKPQHIASSEQPAALQLSAIADNPDCDPLDFLADALSGAVEGYRWTTMFGAVVSAVIKGYSDDEVTDVLLPVYLARHPERERKKCERSFQSALRWIRRRRPIDRHKAREILAQAPWSRFNGR